MRIVVDLFDYFSDSVVVVVWRLASLNQRMSAPKRNITVTDTDASVSSMRLSLESGVLCYSCLRSWLEIWLIVQVLLTRRLLVVILSRRLYTTICYDALNSIAIPIQGPIVQNSSCTKMTSRWPDIMRISFDLMFLRRQRSGGLVKRSCAIQKVSMAEIHMRFKCCNAAGQMCSAVLCKLFCVFLNILLNVFFGFGTAT